MNYVRQARKQRGLSLVELSEKAKISLGYLHFIDAGYSRISQKLKRRLAEVLGTPVEELFPSEPEKEEEQ